MIFLFSILSCSNNPDSDVPTATSTRKKDNFPKLEIINKGQITITSVSLEGYKFSNLSLKQNQSMIFELKDGMPSGYKNVKVSIRYRPYRVSNAPIPPIIRNLDFADGVTTSLEIRYYLL